MQDLHRSFYGPADPLALFGAAIILMLVGLCTAYVPARRATKVDRAVVLTQAFR